MVAKNKNPSGALKKNRYAKQPARAPRREQRTPRMSEDDMVLRQHWAMASDPCGAVLAQSAYRGQAGITSRFTQSITLNSGTNTNFLYAANPAALASTYSTVPTTSGGNVYVYGTGIAGQSFVAANASTCRIVGFCVSVEYLGSELARSGKLYTGIVPTDTIAGGATYSVDNVKTILVDSCRTPDHQLEAKWFPGVHNEEYSQFDSLGETFIDANNMLIICGESLPPGCQILLRETVIVEWLPKVGLGYTAPVGVGGSNPVAAFERLHAMASKDPSFFAAFRHGAQILSRVAKKALGPTGYEVGRRAVNFAVKAAPVLLSL